MDVSFWKFMQLVAGKMCNVGLQAPLDRLYITRDAYLHLWCATQIYRPARIYQEAEVKRVGEWLISHMVPQKCL